MAGSVNKVILVGNLGRDPEVKSMQDGRSMVNMSIATSDTWRDRQSGERKERITAEQLLRDGGVGHVRNIGRGARRGWSSKWIPLPRNDGGNGFPRPRE